MFVISLKPNSKKIFIILSAVLLTIVMFLSIGLMRKSEPDLIAKCDKGEYSLLAKDNKQRLEFFGQFGLRTSSEPVECKKVTIPFEFNEVYQNYNDIQLSQGLNLEDYKGVSCDIYTYDVMNYPGDENVVVNILVYEGTVIGGDICSRDAYGFMKGFFKE